MKRVTGIGGIFFKSNNPNQLKEWYKKHLGFNIDEYGTMFISAKDDQQLLQWSPLSKDTDYFQPSTKEFMINYRVENLTKLVELLESEGITFLDDIAIYDYGKFIHLLDPEGNKIELWEPVDKTFIDDEKNNLT